MKINRIDKNRQIFFFCPSGKNSLNLLKHNKAVT